ncbi:NAD-dependent epimerase/dehydratase [Gemmatirosa kalamazoonensis]|uniref:NAD-dependent epimerase/dehydratase n=1 Tax=Gemmatirosa kalamazoonensis TaxID=861299 RepID=W0RF12_9BACT|nr:NAD(P)-dependent oxidoreductase [Gemmatirosa kalamazoonensis]AHG89032.1 NAD-dependent epimerase/dehydratase [Gemmatirosa kalamazoonensis]
MSGTRIFVTGATGVVGRRVVPLLVAAGHAVTAVGRSPEKRSALERQGAAAVDVDLLDAAALRRALHGHDAVLNLATHMPRSTNRMLLPSAWRENDRVRRDGSAALVDAMLAAGVPRLVQESFAPIYEDGGDAWIDESWPVRPAPYNESVLDAERSEARFTERGGTGVVLRFALFYGPDSTFLHDAMPIARRGWLALPGDASAFVSSVSHDDAATAAVAALGVPAGIYNVTDDEPLTRGAWGTALAAALGAPPPRPLPRWLTRLGGSTLELLSRSQRMSNRKLRAAAGWAPRYTSVREGFAAVERRILRS